MTYLVIWKADAALGVGRLESAADDPTRIREAARQVDYPLRRHARDMGEGRIAESEVRGPHRRVWFGDVLAVYFQMDEVDVLAVGLSRRPKR